MLFKSTLAFAFATLLSGFALAEPGPLREACRNDVKALCGSVQPGGGRIRDCMSEHRAQLSSACKLAIADRMLERKASRSANGSTPAISR
jgi:Cysteine rich repeat